jgi:Tfp pilus assembly protein PilF
VTLPFTLLLLDWWPLARTKEAGAWRRLVVEKVPLFLLAAASCVVTFFVQRAAGAVGHIEAFPIGDRVGNALISYVRYVANTFWPVDLAVLYVHERPLVLWKAVGAAAVLSAVTVLAVRQAARRPWFVVGWLWFLGTLVPVIGLVQVGMQSMADRYTYVPLVGLLVAVVWGAADLLDWERRRPIEIPVAATFAVAACALLARHQLGFWTDSEALWRRAVAVAPDGAVARDYLGRHLCDLGRFDEAAAEFEASLRGDPSSAEVRTNLGYVRMRQGRLDLAVEQFREAVRLRPDYADAHENWGYVLRLQGRLDEAVAKFHEALRLRPDFAAARRDLAGALAAQGRVDEAIREFELAVRLDPRDEAARAGLEELKRLRR